jgi:signal transduction histidine kinase
MGTTAQGGDSHARDPFEPMRLAEVQTALRRVATLVASGSSAIEVFSAVAEEVARALHLGRAAVCRYDEDGTTLVVLSVFGDSPEPFTPGSRWPLDGLSMSAEVLRTGRPVRFEDYTDVPGSLAAEARGQGFTSVAGAPIVVDGRVWGVISTSTSGKPFPNDLEDHLGEFTELVGTAIANAESREELTRLADEQAALRRVATLVALGAPAAELFEAVCIEVARLVPAEGSALARFEPDGMVTALSGWTTTGGYGYEERRFASEGTVSGLVFETHRPARIDYEGATGHAAAAARKMGWRSSVGAPITVQGHLWGALSVVSASALPLPPDTERRLVKFTELVATAIANAESREELTRLAEEQAALRRVATLVAQGKPHGDVFEAISAEVARLVPADAATLVRYRTDGTVETVGSWSAFGGPVPVGLRLPLSSSRLSQVILETHRPARMDRLAEAGADVSHEIGWRSAVGAPVVVEGRLWGAMDVGSKTARPLPDGTEERLTEFTALLASAIANAESRAEVDASRARIVATADATRRRIERDLHDGAQQQLLSLALEIRALQAGVPPELSQHRYELAHVADGLARVIDVLREIALGLHPAILGEGGLGPALNTIARRSPIPVELQVGIAGRLPETVEVAAYYVVSEALTNAAKHAHASNVWVDVDRHHKMVRVCVHDDGHGGADPARGSGLLGLKDRAAAIGGTIVVDSPPGKGTSLTAELPLAGHDTG